MLAGLLGNIGCKSDDEDWYLGARGIKFWRHPGAHLSKKPGRWLVAAELVETTRLFGRGLAAIEPQWIPPIAGAPAEEAAAGAALGEEGRRGGGAGARHAVRHRRLQQQAGELRPARPAAAREIFIREALVEGEIDTRLPFLAHNRS
jgi:ATP-dependent helicase HrpA